ncbi:PREDICTED: probable helicase senataxin [Cyphomyrmex costatus]|uniref:probable helicase senataxin n=1 Tax=Cyphomyrmex costatus TaxID=456900 RepID=UPI00085243DB|nr:PREDICTED: probable helicase senataxin [Cyphomyrmex costatus]
MDFALERLNKNSKTRFVLEEHNRSSSNGIYINGDKKKCEHTVKLHENDIIGIGCPEIDLNNEGLYVFKVCIIKSPILYEEEEINILSETVSNNDTPQENIPHVIHDFKKRCGSNLSCDMTVPNKKPNVMCNNILAYDSSSSKGFESNLSHENQILYNSNTTNNLEIRHVTNISADDDIEIIHASLAKDVGKNTMTYDLKSTKYLNGNKSDFVDKIDVSGVESSNRGDVNNKENSEFVHKADQTKYESELQITDDEGTDISKRDVTCNKPRIKKIKHEPKMQFSEIDVVDLSDNEEGVFPYSQLFDIKYDGNIENKREIKQECTNDDEPNTEKIGLLNIDDEIIILTDSEDEDNPWLERLSRSQLLNEDIKPVLYDSVIKDEIDLGIWDDEFSNIESSEIPCISQISCNKETPCNKEISCDKEIPFESRTSVIVFNSKIKNKENNYNTNLPTPKVDAMDVDDVGVSNNSSTRHINKSKQISDINTNKNKELETHAEQDLELNKHTIEGVKQKLTPPTTEVGMMVVVEAGASNNLSTRGIDANKSINDVNINVIKKKTTHTKQDLELNKQTIKGIKQKLIIPTTEVGTMDIDEASASNDFSTGNIYENKEINDRKVNIKKKTNAKQYLEFLKQTNLKQKSVSPTTKVDAMDIDEASVSNDFSTGNIYENKEINDRKINIKKKTDAKQCLEFLKQTKNLKQKSVSPTTKVDAMDIDEASVSNDFSTGNIYENKEINDRKINIKKKTDAKECLEFLNQTKSLKQKSVSPTTKVDAMDIDEASPSNNRNIRDVNRSKRITDINIDDKKKTDTKQDIKLPKQTELVKQKIITPTIELKAMDIDELSSSNDLNSNINRSKQITDTNIDKNKQKTSMKQDVQKNEQTLESIKQKLSAKSPKRQISIIEPLNLPTRRRRPDYNKDKATKVQEISQSRITKEKRVSELTERLNNNLCSKEQKKSMDRKEKSKAVTDSSSLSEIKSGSISKDEKKKIIEQRKMKLKEIAVEKKLAAENDQSMKRRNKARAKISFKTRGDFLTEQEPRVSKSLPDKSTELLKSKKQSINVTNVLKESTISDKKTQKNKKTDFFKDTVNNIAASLQQSLYLNNIKTASEKNTLDCVATNDNKKQCSSSKHIKKSNIDIDPTVKVSELQDKSTKSSSVVQKENFAPNSSKSELLKSSIRSTIKMKINKKVTFSDKFEIHEYDIDPGNTLNKLGGKDAPIPTNKLIKPVTYTDWSPRRLEEFLLCIFMWNPVWLEEQRYLKSEPPIMLGELQAMRLSYDSYKQYYDVAMPLLLLEIWCVMTKDFEMVEKNMQRTTVMCSIVENSITQTPIPSTNLFLSTLTLQVLVNKEDLNNQRYPIYGDLTYFEYVQNEHGKQTFHKIFAYVTNMQYIVITDSTSYNRDLQKYVKNPYTIIMYTVLTRPLKHIIVNRVQRFRTVTYLRSNIRMVQALQYLPNSSLSKLIVNPKIEDYQLPPLDEHFMSSSLVTKDDLNPKQLEAVFRVTNTVLKKEAKLCFIQGPPGTGKSKVIVNLVTQILYGCQDKKSLRILVCAPSNAAIDEIVKRLLNVRSSLKQKRFNMVRIGRLESMHPLAKDISVSQIAKRHLTNIGKQVTTDNCIEDLSSLLARINSVKTELENIQNIHEEKRYSLNRQLFETQVKYALMKFNNKSIDNINPKERAKYQRMSENIVLQGANIIACTLSSCYTNQMESLFGGHKERISVCIVDEATQSCEAETLIPLMLGVNTLVLVGDPNQLPATILSQRAKKLGLDQSVFSRIQNIFESQSNSPIIMLNMQYRMEYAISYWPNRYFYGGKLKNATDYRMKFPFHAYRVLNHNFTQNNDKFSNTTEAEFVANIIYTMLTFAKWESTSTTITLGVLTPYNNQRTLVLNKINEKISSVPDDVKKKITFEVNTVDGFQGQERDVIIMSCVRSNGIGFLSDKQRLCVALTRAKHSLILCGNFNTFMKDRMWKALLTDARNRGILCRIDANATPNTIKTYIIK